MEAIVGDKLPDGWWRTGATWTSENGAIAVVGGCAGGKVIVTFHGPPRSTLEEAERDRLDLIAGLQGGADLIKAREQIDTLLAKLDRAAERHDAIVECLDAIRAPQEATIPERIYAWRNGVQAIITAADRERDAALKELATLKNRRAGDHAEHLATLNEIGKALNAYPAVDGVTVHYSPHGLAGAVRAQGKALHEARADRLRLAKELEVVRDRDTVPQLLRDSMRVTQEESARLKADMARKDAEIASLRQRVAASEAYTQHLLAALNAVSGFKGPQ